MYEVLDRKRNAILALKVLRQTGPHALYRFKQEFRSLSGITHRNLVTLYELLAEGDAWCLTMELVSGSDFITYHRSSAGRTDAAPLLSPDDSSARFAPTLVSTDGMAPGGDASAGDSAEAGPPLEDSPAPPLAPSSLGRLLGSLRQLVEGLLFLHEQGLIHRDVKPSNVLCTSLGRVVILDFGLVQHTLSEFEPAEPLRAGIAGTPDYMSPEQALEQQATVASDWYSVGVLLYEALAGRLPFSGTSAQVLRQKISQVPPPPPLGRGPVLEALRALCMQLLSREPALRPSGAALLSRLQALEDRLGHHFLRGAREDPGRPPRSRGEAPLVGRQRQLAQLADAFEASRQGRSVVALCRGESGVGKSALCRRFLKDLTAVEPQAVVLSGRCYAHEDVPFKALDGVVDSLSRFLSTRPREELAKLLPRDIRAAARLFPVLMQVAAITEAPPLRIADDLQVKQAAAATLRELACRLSERWPIVLYIDDLQWGDPDGVSLLLELLRPPAPPPLLTLVAHRSDEEASSVALTRLRNGLVGELGQSVSLCEVAVEALTAHEAAALALRMLPPAAQERAATIASDSGGNPFFISELSHSFWTDQADRPESDASRPGPITLDGLIRSRVARLPRASRDLLSVVVVAGHPIPRAAIALAAGDGGAEMAEPQALALLRSEQLIRVRHAQAGSRGQGPREELVVYHDRVREALVAGLSPSDVASGHLRLAEALLACGQAEPEQMVFHLQHGGDLRGAARYAVQASAQAYNVLAYHQAARLCRAALSTGQLAPSDELTVKARLADALVGAGHPREAAEIYLELAARAPAELGSKWRQQAAKQFFISGHIQEGHRALAALLPAAQLRIPKTSFGCLCSLIFYQLLVIWHGLEFEERTEAEVPALDILRLDTCEAIASSTAVDPLLAASCWSRYLLLALRAGEPRRIVLGLTGAAGLLFAFGAAPARIEKILTRAQALAERQRSAYGVGRCIFVRGQLLQLRGIWRESLSELRRATEILRGEALDATALIDFVGSVEILDLRWMGVLHPLAEKLQSYLKDAVERGRQSHELNVRLVGGFLLHLRDDAPDRAEAYVQAAQHRLGEEMSLAHVFGLDARMMILLYQGRAREAWPLLVAQRQRLERSGLLRVNFFWTVCQNLHSLVGLASAQPDRVIEKEARRLRRSRCAFGAPLSTLYLALLRRRQGRSVESLALLEDAERALAACDMSLHASCARFRRGGWLGGAEGERHLHAAREWMIGQGIRSPERMVAMLVPDPP